MPKYTLPSRILIQHSYIRECTQNYIKDLLSRLEAMNKELITFGVFFSQVPQFEELKQSFQSAQICIHKNMDLVLSQFDYAIYKYELREANLHLLDNMRNLKHNLRFYIDSLFFRVHNIMNHPQLKMPKKEPSSLTLHCQQACLQQHRVRLGDIRIDLWTDGVMEQLLKKMGFGRSAYLGSVLHKNRSYCEVSFSSYEK